MSTPIDFTSKVLTGAKGRVRLSGRKVLVTYREGDTYREVIAARPETQYITENYGKAAEHEYTFMCSKDLQQEVLEQAAIFADLANKGLTTDELKGLL